MTPLEQARDWVDRRAMVFSNRGTGRAIGYLDSPDGTVVQLVPVGLRVTLRGQPNAPTTSGHCWWVSMRLCREAVAH